MQIRRKRLVSVMEMTLKVYFLLKQLSYSLIIEIIRHVICRHCGHDFTCDSWSGENHCPTCKRLADARCEYYIERKDNI